MNASDRDNGGARQAREDRAIALSALALGTRRGDDCPAPEEIVAWQEQRLDAARAQHVMRHVAECDPCFGLWRELVAVTAVDPRHAQAVAPGALARLRAWFARAPRGGAGFAALAAGAAAALLVAVYVQLQPRAQGPALPDYELSLQGRALFRGAAPATAGEAVSFAGGTHFELVLRPDHAVAEAVAARAWVQQGDAALALDTTPQQAARGVIVVAGTIGRDWRLPSGDAQLLVVVGRAEALPDLAAVRQALGESTRVAVADWTAWRVPVHTDAAAP
jgi:hypothetical protein